MFSRTLISMTASVLITAGSLAGLASLASMPVPIDAVPATIDGMPVTRLPGMTVSATVGPESASADTDATEGVTVAVVNQTARLITGSHLGMPYYSFGSGLPLNSKE